jgi:uncharacterized protein YacL
VRINSRIISNRFSILSGATINFGSNSKIKYMQTGLLHLHNLLRWIILVLLLLSILKSYTGMTSKKEFEASDKKIWLFTMIAAHITLLLGLYQWLLGRYGLFTYVKPEGISMMKDPYLRFFQMEHPVSMILAIVLITLGHGMAKKNVDDEFDKLFSDTSEADVPTEEDDLPF